MPRALLALAAVLAAAPAAAQTPTADAAGSGVDFFEKKIRPALAEHCYSCHSADAAAKNKLKGGLALDTRDAVRAGGDSGPALVAGDPAKSLIVESLRYTGDLRMPPKGKLPPAVVADFEKWVKMGAPDPRTAATGVKQQVGLSIDEGRKFWSYRPVAAPAAPAVKNAAWPATDIDRYVLAALEAKGLNPAADADRATLARRVYFDLHGLPPTPEEIDAFVRDADPKAFEKLVDTLLASPRFGERWGRHWLDTARFAESVTLRGLVFKEAWRYRDYVIDAFNRDVPLDQFIREQLAGDLLAAATPEERARLIIATTYLQLGNTNLEEQDKRQLRMDVVDEQLDVIGKGLLGQTISCARCHDHKFDPIPTADYYALAGILRNVKALKDANVSNWVEVPLPAAPEVEAAVKQHEAAVADLQSRIKVAKAKAPKDAAAERTVKGVLAVKDVPGVVVDDAAAKKVGTWKDSTFSGTYIGAGYTHDDAKGAGEKTITFDPDLPATGRYEVWFAYSPGGSRAKDVPVTVFSADGEKTLHLDLTPNPPIRGRFVSLGQYRFEKDGQSFVLISNEGAKGHVTADAVAFIPVDQVPKDKAAPAGKVAAADQAAALEAELKKLQAAAPKRPMAMSVVEEAKIEDAKINVRGIVHNQGAVAPRGFLKVATAGPVPPMPANQSGRVQLADWVASKDNPLTARVYANRAWHWLFGSGLVRTADNFGTTGEAPSNPELLDHLATRLVQDGWSVKKLVRAIVLSRTYRQSSRADARTIAADPENRLFGHANRRRLEAEAIRDTMLTVSGKLEAFAGGPNFKDNVAADYGYRHTSAARSVYLPVFRNALPEVFEAFDFADPSMVVGKRSTSTVAPQALFMMNNSFPAEQAKAAAARVLAENLPTDGARLDRAYRLALGRLPTDGERAAMRRYLANQSGSPPAAWAAVFQALFASADFRYVE
ncbi:DUF1553 domain-containing protein [Urbifossiella limnaea]|uniref:Xanthan lyase n=1 Tax=Urbifossiella limnaea TaxID=2528023 RepID=A0A517XMQ6_9BACT|nr:DUF1553 domain-containing protein [Urbifossiella limnaea]QDU18785.1 Xanthan lyase precursor [Urbifossiella limnaea]